MVSDLYDYDDFVVKKFDEDITQSPFKSQDTAQHPSLVHINSGLS